MGAAPGDPSHAARASQRVRDMPPPRRTSGAVGAAVPWVLQWPYRAILSFLLWTGIRPFQLTLLSFVLMLATGVLILVGAWFWAGVVLVGSGVCDVFDGSVARQRGIAKRSGAFMDSVGDRVSDMVLFSTLFWNLADKGDRAFAALALVTLIVSLAVSHVRAEAEAAGVSLTEGLFQRLERVLATIVGLVVPGAMKPVLIALTVLGALTVVQRGFSALKGA